MFEYKEPDFRKCIDCEHAKFAETFRDKDGESHPIYRCGKHKQIITDLTFVSSTCKGVDFKRRGE